LCSFHFYVGNVRIIFLFLCLGSDSKFHIPMNNLLVYSFENFNINSLDKKEDGKKFSPEVRVKRSLLQQTLEAYLFCKIVPNITLKFLGLFATSSALRTGILLLI
jgi:hypothetical protein